MTRHQVRTSVRDESVIIAVIGTVLGLALALGAGVAVTLALQPQGISRLVVPLPQLAIIGALGAVTGVLAALAPARRAARIDILRAVGV
jgi:putative ABC transport system permease protein